MRAEGQGGRAEQALGLLSAVVGVALTTALLVPLAGVAPVESLGVAYLVLVLLVSWRWPGPAGPVAAVAGAAAYNFFLLPPTGSFHLDRPTGWAGLAVLLVAAGLAGGLAQRVRGRALELEHRRAEAALSAEAARLLLRGGRLPESLPAVSERVATALGLPGAEVVLGDPGPREGARAFALGEDGRRIGTLLVPAGAPAAELERIGRHVVPALEALLAAATEREELLDGVVETAALRRSDVLKTTLLRAMSHDLRSPLTAILTAQAALGSPALSGAERDELVHDIGTEATRLARLVDKLLDLSQLEAGAAAPQPGPCSLAEVLEAAVEGLAPAPGAVDLRPDPGLPDVRADAAQLERALANLLENAVRLSGGHPVRVRARRVGGRVVVRIADRGPGVPEALRQRVFEPFFRVDRPGAGGDHRGSGLGLAIARGFVEANGGRVRVEGAPGEGATFVVDFPAAAPVRAPA